jgi:hypothetical protein
MTCRISQDECLIFTKIQLIFGEKNPGAGRLGGEPRKKAHPSQSLVGVTAV